MRGLGGGGGGGLIKATHLMQLEQLFRHKTAGEAKQLSATAARERVKLSLVLHDVHVSLSLSLSLSFPSASPRH